MIRRPSPRAGQRAAPPPGTDAGGAPQIWSRLGSDPDANQLGGKRIAPCGSGCPVSDGGPVPYAAETLAVVRLPRKVLAMIVSMLSTLSRTAEGGRVLEKNLAARASVVLQMLSPL